MEGTSMIGSPREKYDTDAKFRTLVHVMYQMIEKCEFSGSEIREAAMLALIMHEERHVHANIAAELSDEMRKIREESIARYGDRF